MSNKQKRTPISRQFYSYARLFHVYTSTLLFGLMLFFCLTGIFLNHHWYDSSGNDIDYQERALSTEQVTRWGLEDQGPWQADLTQITTDIRHWYELPQPHSIDVDEEFAQITLDFKVPAGFATVVIVAQPAVISIERESGSLVGVLNDLHKGRHSGKAWSWVIDITAALMIFFSITGLIIMYQGRRFKLAGNGSLIAGLLTPVLIYWFYVPLI